MKLFQKVEFNNPYAVDGAEIVFTQTTPSQRPRWRGKRIRKTKKNADWKQRDFQRVINCTSDVPDVPSSDLPDGGEQKRFVLNHSLNESDHQNRNALEKHTFVQEVVTLAEWCRGEKTVCLCEWGHHRSTGTACSLMMASGLGQQDS